MNQPRLRGRAIGRVIERGILLFCCWCAAVSLVDAEVKDDDRQLVDETMERLLAVVDRPEGYEKWPPRWKIIDDDETNAFATLDADLLPSKFPIVRIHRGLLDQIVQNDENRLAFVLAHELSHLLKQHVIPTDKDQPRIIELAFSREQELEADQLGMEITVKAGYSYRQAMDALERMRKLTNVYSSFEGNGVGHPSWSDRISLLQTDQAQKTFWQAMSSFETGAYLLQIEQYRHAEGCFERVTREFPRCTEALSNLGYAQLMRYCDGLEPADLREFGVGQLVTGGFYQRPASMEVERGGIQEKLWFDAVDSLNQVLTIRDDLVLPKANLAIAYLVHPSGTPDLDRATELFDDMLTQLTAAENIDELDSLARATILANAWIGVYHRDSTRSSQVLAQIESSIHQVDGRATGQAALARLRMALDYTRARQLAQSDSLEVRREAVPMLERYLTGTAPSSSWWPLAYEQYDQLTMDLKLPALNESELAKPKVDKWRPVAELTLPTGGSIGLADITELALQELGAPAAQLELVDGSKLQRYEYPERGLAVIAGRRVVAVVLNDVKSPPIELRQAGLASAPSQLHVGMPRRDVEALLGDTWSSQNMSVVDPRRRDEFYLSTGIAIGYRNGVVSEIIVAVPPRGK
ncbi:MAG: M48 family metallopeptidase [Pirellulales bacterium]